MLMAAVCPLPLLLRGFICNWHGALDPHRNKDGGNRVGHKSDSLKLCPSRGRGGWMRCHAQHAATREFLSYTSGVTGTPKTK